ncbi:hypothetical protein LZ30DRAFT_711011 [Colletotrichum cereale]|nr:hypothetical protein LZ30DRAFT_711011 [Colletotrichum cereale]
MFFYPQADVVQALHQTREFNMIRRVLRDVPPAVPEDDIPPPDCRECGGPTTLRITRSSNRRGNAGRPYYICVPCRGRFCSFGDNRGCHPDNPPCDCGRPSRLQVAGRDRNPPGRIHYVCQRGGCDFYRFRADVKVDEAMVSLLDRLSLI